MKRSALTNVGESSNPLGIQIEQKGERRVNSLSLFFFFFFSWRCIFSCSWMLELLVLRPLDSGTFASSPLVPRPSDSDRITALGFLALQLAGGRSWDFFISIITCEPNPIKKKTNKTPLIHISIYPIGSVSLRTLSEQYNNHYLK